MKIITTTLEKLINNLRELSYLEGDYFKSRAYSNAADNLFKELSERTYQEKEDFYDIKGIGEGINSKILEYRSTGKINKLQELRESKSDYLDPKIYKVRKGFITKRISYELALNYLEEIKKLIVNGFLSEAGSLRRKLDTIGDIDILVTAADYPDIIKSLSSKYRVLVSGEVKSSFIIDELNLIQLDILATDPIHYPFKLLYYTGSKEFNIMMRGVAKAKGLLLNEYGLFSASRESNFPLISEKEIFEMLGMNYTVPIER